MPCAQGDPLQLFSLLEVMGSEGTGPEAMLTCKVVDSNWDKPMNFLPQGGGPADGEEIKIMRKDLLPANPETQDMTPDLSDLDKCVHIPQQPLPVIGAVSPHRCRCLLTCAGLFLAA